MPCRKHRSWSSKVFLVIFSVWLVKSGIEAMGRWCVFILPVLIISIVSTSLMSVKDMHLENLKPVGGAGYGTLMSGAFSAFAFLLAKSVLFLSVFGSLKNNKRRDRIFIWGNAIAPLLILAITFRNLLVLGAPNLEKFYFPSCTAASILSLGEFFTRVEVLIGLNFLITVPVKISICLYSACMGLNKLFGQSDYRVFAMPVGLAMMTLSTIIYRNTAEMVSWVEIYRF